MNDLRATLDDLARDAPLHRADWADVVRRSHRKRRNARPRKRLLLALAIVALLAAAGTAIGVSTSLLTPVKRFHAELPDDPHLIGSAAEIAGGEDWALVAWQSDRGICLDFAVPGNAAFDCDFPVRSAKPPSNTLGSGPPYMPSAASSASPGSSAPRTQKPRSSASPRARWRASRSNCGTAAFSSLASTTRLLR